MQHAQARPAPESPAEIYEARFVPALFQPWAATVAEIAEIAPGAAALDVACGTGVLARAALERVGPSGRVVGLDANPEMLAVARRLSDRIDWVDGRAEAPPFEDAGFDAVVSQFGMMFFEDRAQALREMARVLKPGGRLVVAVCDDVERSPGYAAFARLLDRLFGREIGDAFRAPFILGDPERLARIAAEAGLSGAHVERRVGSVRFKSIEDLVSTERACAWTLGGLLNDAQFETLRGESERALAPFAQADGRVAFDMPALILSWRQRPA